MLPTRGTLRGVRSLALLPPWLPPPDTIGAVFGGRYRVTHRIAEGTTGVVYCAEDLHEGTSVALRLLRPELSSSSALYDYLQARIGGPLAVRGLAEVRDVGRGPSGLYEISDYIDGEHLGTLLQRRGRMAWPKARAIVRRLATILGDLHAHHTRHGYLQARSCYVVGDGADAAILAPGLDAYLLDVDESLLSAASLTICRYAAPERASGDPSDHRIDVYALGVILYEILTARLPFEDPNPNRLLAMHMLTPPPLPRQVAPAAGIPEAVEALILRALAKDPDERFLTMKAMVEALDACPSEVEVASAASPAPVGRANPYAPTLVGAGLAAAAVQASASAATAATTIATSPAPHAPSERVASSTAQPAPAPVASQEPSGSVPASVIASAKEPSGSVPASVLAKEPSGSVAASVIASAKEPSWCAAASVIEGAVEPSGSVPASVIASAKEPSGSVAASVIASAKEPSGSVAASVIASAKEPSGSVAASVLASAKEPSGSVTAAAVEAALAPTSPRPSPFSFLPPRSEGGPSRGPLRLPPLPQPGRPGIGTVGPSLVIPNLVGDRSGLAPLAGVLAETNAATSATTTDAATTEATTSSTASTERDNAAAHATTSEAASAAAAAPANDSPANGAPGSDAVLSEGTGPERPGSEDMSERTASEAGDEPHPSASGSMRASASGSRRIVHLVDVRPPGESQSRGRIPASESQSRGQIPATEAATGEAASPPTVTGHAGEATMQRAVSAALRGASIDASPRDAEADPATSSSSSLSRIRRDESTIQAITGEDDTLATSGLHSRPSRGVITWVAAAVAAMVVGTAGYAFYTSEVERDMEADAVVASVATPVTPSIGPMIVPEAVVAPTAPIDEPAEPEAAEAVAEAAVVAAVAEPPASGRRSKKGGKTKPTKARVRKRTREAEPEEDDVLEQVRKYMRQKQEAEAARKAAAANPPQGALAGP